MAVHGEGEVERGRRWVGKRAWVLLRMSSRCRLHSMRMESELEGRSRWGEMTEGRGGVGEGGSERITQGVAGHGRVAAEGTLDSRESNWPCWWWRRRRSSPPTRGRLGCGPLPLLAQPRAGQGEPVKMASIAQLAGWDPKHPSPEVRSLPPPPHRRAPYRQLAHAPPLARCTARPRPTRPSRPRRCVQLAYAPSPRALADLTLPTPARRLPGLGSCRPPTRHRPAHRTRRRTRSHDRPRARARPLLCARLPLVLERSILLD